MARRTIPPFLAVHVGSLLRPETVLRARTDLAAGRLTPAELTTIEDSAIRQAVKLQEDVGLQSATDGEFRRASWHVGFIYQLGGITKANQSLRVDFHNQDGGIEFTSAALLCTTGSALNARSSPRPSSFLGAASPRRCRS